MNGSPGLRERKKLDTRRSIETAALELFLEQGFAATTMAAIARAADVSLRTVAVHYPTKHDLVFGEQERDVAALVERIEQRPEGVATLDAIQTWVCDEILADKVDPHSVRVMCSHVIHSDPELRTRARGSLAAILPVVATGIAHDLGVAPDHMTPQLTASATVGMFTLLSEQRPDDEPDLEHAADAIAQIFVFLRAGLAALPVE